MAPSLLPVRDLLVRRALATGNVRCRVITGFGSARLCAPEIYRRLRGEIDTGRALAIQGDIPLLSASGSLESRMELQMFWIAIREYYGLSLVPPCWRNPSPSPGTVPTRFFDRRSVRKTRLTTGPRHRSVGPQATVDGPATFRRNRYWKTPRRHWWRRTFAPGGGRRKPA